MDFKAFIDRNIAADPKAATLLRKLYRTGVFVKGYDREEWVTFKSERDMLEFAFNLDEFWLYTEEGSWVFFVMGQGVEGLTDYTVTLDAVLDEAGITAWIDKNM